MKKLQIGSAVVVGAVAVAAALAVEPAVAEAPPAVCSQWPAFTSAPEYYRIDLVSTKRVPGTAFSRGTGEVTFSASPFTVSLAVDGSYKYDVSLDLVGLPEPLDGVYAVWFTTTTLDEVQRVGALGDARHVEGTVEWNQFITVVSLEPSDSEIGDRWSGPIVMRGLSRSGMLHTMAGHGPFQQENCAAYGY